MKLHSLLLLGVILGLTVFGARAQEAPPFLDLRAGKVTLPENADAYSSGSSELAPAFFDGHYYLMLQFHAIPDFENREVFKAKGVELLQYIPHQAFTAKVSIGVTASTLQEIGVRSWYVPEANTKMRRDLIEGPIPDGAMRGGNTLEVSVITQKKEDYGTLVELLPSLGVTFTTGEPLFGSFQAEVALADVESLASHPLVQWVEPVPGQPQEENLPGKRNHRSTILNDGVRGLTGNGIQMGIWDGGEAGPHADFTGRVTLAETSSPSNHGTHVAGTMAGAGIIEPFARGMAPEALIYSYNFSGSTTTEVANSITNYGVVITQNSWGMGPTCGTYDPYSNLNRNQDILAYNNSFLVQVFSAGNSATSCTGGWGTTTGKAAKHTLTVGALTNADAIANFSSRGPVEDGRVKPEVSVVGVSVYSTNPNDAYGTSSGTSMAAPGTSGTVAQVYERYRQLNSADPYNGLIKAVMCNTADDLWNANVDYRYGFGRINGLRAVKAIEQNRYLVNNVTNGGTFTHTITVPPGATSLKVAASWVDPEAASGANPALVHDLDLTVTDPSSTTWLPWVLDPANPANVATRQVDNRNIIEQVTLDNPAAGTYTLTINGTSVPSAPNQQFALTWEIDQPYVEVTYPSGGERLNPGDTEVIQWDASGVSGNQTVEYSTDNGATWTVISSSVPADDRRLNWTVPNTLTGQALVRVSDGAISAQSAATFMIMNRVTGLTSDPCNGSALISWNTTSGATEYDVLVFNTTTNVYDVAGTTTNTFFNVTGLTNGTSYWVTVVARNVPNSAESLRANAISVTPSATAGGVDLVMLSLEAPLPGCGTALTANESVTVRFRNMGCATLAAGTTVPMSFTEATTGTNANENFNLPSALAPGQDISYTFTTTVNMSVAQAYSFDISANFGTDVDNANDAINGIPVDNFTISTVLPYLEDFENPNPAQCWSFLSYGTGPGFFMNTGAVGGAYGVPNPGTQYALVNDDACASPGCGNPSDDWLISPMFDLTNYNMVETNFDYVYESGGGTTANDAFVLVSTDFTTWTPIHTFVSDPDTWNNLTLDLSAYAGQSQVWVAFHYDDLGNWGYGLAVEDFRVYEVPLQAVTFSPADGATGVSVSSNVVITFNQPPTIAGGAITLTDGTTPITINLPDPQVTVSGNQLIIDPSVNLNPNVTYDVTISNGALTTSGGLSWAGVTTGNWQFTTGVSPLTADFSATPTDVCTGDNVTFTDASVGTTGTTTYAWNFGSDATPATANTAGPHTVSYSSAGTKTVTLTLNGTVVETKNAYITVTAPQNFYPDNDGDGFGDATAAAVSTCTAPTNHVTNNRDCDDTNSAVRPGAEVCGDGIDNNCNGLIDEGCGGSSTSPPITQPMYAANFITAIGQSSSSILVTWGDTNTDEQGYYLYRAIGNGGYSLHAIIPAQSGSEITYMDTGLDADIQYHYYVVAYKGTQLSPHSDQAEDYTFPEVPDLVGVTAACYGGSGNATVTAMHQSGLFRWYADSTSAEPLRFANGQVVSTSVYETGSLTQEAVFYVSALGFRYESANRLRVSIPVRPRPTAELLGDLTRYECGGSTLLTATAQANATYTWYRNYEQYAQTTVPELEVTTPGLYTLRVEEGGCGAQADAQVRVFLNQVPEALIYQGTQATFCETGLLSARETRGVNYQWEDENGNVLGTGTSLAVNQAGTYTLRATQRGCENTSSIDVSFTDFPTSLSLSSTATDLCPGETTTLDVAGVPAGYTVKWFWNNRQIAAGSATSITTERTGTFRVALEAGTNCERTYADEITVNGNDVPQASILVRADGAFELKTQGDAAVSTVRWFKDGVAQPAWDGQTEIFPTENGTYYAEIEYPTGCTTATRTRVFALTGIENSPEAVKTTLFPNPASTQVKLRIGSDITGEATLSILDVLGRELQRKAITAQEGAVEALDLRGLPSGNYLLQVHHEGGTLTLKFNKE